MFKSIVGYASLLRQTARLGIEFHVQNWSFFVEDALCCPLDVVYVCCVPPLWLFLDLPVVVHLRVGLNG